MKLYHSIDRACQTTLIEALLADTPDGEVCKLPRGEYFLLRPIRIVGREGLTLDGDGSTLIAYYDPCEHYAASSDVFRIEGCKGLTLRNFVIDTSAPANIALTVTEVNLEAKFYRGKVDDAYKMCGRERFMVHYIADAHGSFGHGHSIHDDRPLTVADEIIHMTTELGCETEYYGGNEFKFLLPRGEGFLRHLKVGDRVCVRHTVYGLNTFLLRDSDDTLIEDIDVCSAPGMGILVLPRCMNLTLRRVRFKKHEGSPQLMSGNCDGIHMTGLGGHFEMLDCSFDGLGDDALNVHSTAGTITTVKGDELCVNYTKKYPDGLLSPRFCKAGDRIRVWDGENCTRLGEFTVDSYSGALMRIRELDGEVREGAILQNLAFTPTVEIAHCTVKNSRSRGFIVQAGDTDIHDNRFEGISGEGVKVGTVFKFYMETGINGDFRVRRNKFVRCAMSGAFEARRTVAILSRHTGADESVRQIYNDVVIEDNDFTGTENPLVVVSSARTASVCNNGEIKVEIIGCDNIFN